MEEIKKSIKATLYERTTSPFFGTFILSWLIWNWKIIYVTLFVSEKTIKTDKLNYLLNNHLIDKFNLILWPAISTVVLLTIFPFITNGAYWLKLKFDKWKKDKKNEVELKQLLTLEQSIELREQIANQEERFEKILSDKNLRIQQLEEQLKTASKNKSVSVGKPITKTVSDDKSIPEEVVKLVETIKNDSNLKTKYNYLLHIIQGGWSVDISEVSAEFLAKLESLDIIINKGGRVYQWGDQGKNFVKLINK